MTAPFRDATPGVEAALSEAERLRAEDASLASAKRQEAWLLGCVVVLAVLCAGVVAAVMHVLDWIGQMR